MCCQRSDAVRTKHPMWRFTPCSQRSAAQHPTGAGQLPCKDILVYIRPWQLLLLLHRPQTASCSGTPATTELMQQQRHLCRLIRAAAAARDSARWLPCGWHSSRQHRAAGPPPPKRAAPLCSSRAPAGRTAVLPAAPPASSGTSALPGRWQLTSAAALAAPTAGGAGLRPCAML
ncbi:hypothetical protein COO60DRAFT_1531578 [Scenedesmus sp. NREL 46B-D3]|nr:hypothetical protein COO60DRAFT_1531578 [Scenedesmus sp. NREL 46B-D3]